MQRRSREARRNHALNYASLRMARSDLAEDTAEADQPDKEPLNLGKPKETVVGMNRDIGQSSTNEAERMFKPHAALHLHKLSPTPVDSGSFVG